MCRRCHHMTVAWSLPPAGAVHIWSVCLRRVLAKQSITAEASPLAANELARAAAISCPIVRSRYLAGRTALRTILSKYVPGTSPASLQLAARANGKPFLDHLGSKHRPAVNFNVAHTNDMFLTAVSLGPGEVGVDVEPIARKITSVSRLSRRWMHPDESRLVGDDARTFLRAWTRKEAYVKALGCGVAKGHMRAFKVDAAGNVFDAANSGAWTLVDFSLDENGVLGEGKGEAFVGCVAVEGADRKVDGWFSY